MENQEPPPEEQVTEAMPIVGESQPSKEAPTFTGEQVEFLLRRFAVPGQAVPATSSATSEVRSTRARGGYDSPFGWMHLTSPEVGIQLVISVGMLVLGTMYLVGGVAGARSVDANALTMLQPVLLLAIGIFILVRTFVKWRNSHLYTTTTHVIYAVKPCWPLLILRFEQRAQLPKIDASVYSQNFIELTFRMNSGTLTLDTAAKSDKGLHQLKGVKDVALLQEDIE